MATAMHAEGGGFHSQLLQEPERLPPNNVPHATRLLPQEIDCTCRRENETDSDGAKALQPTPIVEIHTGKPMRLKVKVHIPVKDHPNFNFVGKLLGPKGNSLKQLQEITQTRMAIFGRGSMRDKQKEEELRLQDDPKYHHLREDLHVEITAFAPPAEAYQRIATALTEVKRFLVPDYFDDIRQQQLRELGVLSERKSKLKTVDSSSSNQGSPIYENEDPSELLETGRATISYPSVIKRRQALPYKQGRHINSNEDYQEDSSSDFPYREGTNRFCHQNPRNGTSKEGDSYSTNHEYMFETGTFNGYIKEENTTTGNPTYGDDIDISCTSEELNDEQCVPPRRPFPAAAPRNPVIFRSTKFRNHPYNSPRGYR